MSEVRLEPETNSDETTVMRVNFQELAAIVSTNFEELVAILSASFVIKY